MSSNNHDDMAEFHWMMDMVQTVDVGIVVLDREYRVKVWNGFMESHSGMLPSHVRYFSIFSLTFPRAGLLVKPDRYLRCVPVLL
jgi:hypothetical protein